MPKGNFGKLFAGNIVFIPRHMNEVRFVEEPIAFVSTFNALAVQDGRRLDASSVAAMKGIARYLSSDLARYLYALFGKTRILDSARLEKGDLESVPFPFVNLGDLDLQRVEALDERAITALFAEKVGLDASFIQAVSEYNAFRYGYEDAQVPRAALGAPEEEAVNRYRDMLLEYLADHFGSLELLRLEFYRPNEGDHFGIITVKIGAGNAALSREQFDQLIARLRATLTFSPQSHIAYDTKASADGAT